MIGIDLGTTNSLVAVMEGGSPKVISNELGEMLTPSAVAVAEDGQLLVGRAAKDRLIAAPDSGRSCFKRDMGTDIRYKFGGKQWNPVECSAVVLKEMKRIAELYLEQQISEAVVTVPAYFHDQQRQATLEAAEIAGLKVGRILNEPTAAALAYGYSNPDEEQHLLVFDLGGGTFDVTLLEIFEGVIEVKASAGESRLGGEDYTDALYAWALRESGAEVAGEDRLRVRQNVEVAKRKLSSHDVARIGIKDVEFDLTRKQFEEATSGITARLRPVVSRCLRDGETTAMELDDVLLVGGASRMAPVLGFIQEAFKRIPNRRLDPDRVIAMGAAVQGALCDDDEAVGDLVLTDVCPHTLGIEVSKELAPGRQDEGYFSPLLDRNTTIPTSRSDLFNTLHPQQDEIHLKIFQGEGRKVKDNKRIGDIRIKGLRQRPGQKHAGQIEVRFTYDMNGILEVEVSVLSTGKKHAKVIEQRPGTLTPSQIQAAIKRLAPLKIHPRDLLPNRARLERANRVYAELIGDARDHLTSMVDQFEAALSHQDGESIKITAAVLDSFLRQFFEFEGEVQPGGHDDKSEKKEPEE